MRAVPFVLALALTAVPAVAQLPGAPFKSLLGKASDSALDKLSKPGAFAADSSIRIALPGPAKQLGGLMAMAGKAGVGGDISGDLNAAAGQAASAAKPIFRAAIDKMSVKDAMAMGGSSTGATDYLRKSASSQIAAELSPLVRGALAKTGVLSQTSKLSAVGMNESSLIDYVTQKTADGIFTYMGREETSLRANPMALFGK